MQSFHAALLILALAIPFGTGLQASVLKDGFVALPSGQDVTVERRSHHCNTRAQIRINARCRGV